ncbi:MAG: enoyl-CoA hydratase/isomerase family protein [Alphaproteobacteria bacterium]|nr:enoyl-CoA hydratase/isomerase family protein [Alphaproteobacteria bacterium]
MASELIVAKEGPLTRLTLNRPDRGNALNPALVEALIAGLGDASSDGSRIVVLQGAGKSLCSGFDLTNFDDLSDGDLVTRLVRIEVMLQTLHHMPLPTLALAHGRNFGAGADLFCACSQRVTTSDAQFRMPGLSFGVVLGARRLALRVGQDTARDIQNAGRTFSGDEAAQNNFASQTAAAEGWPDLIKTATQDAGVISATATAGLFRATAVDTNACDMADLARSASTPGLSDRIRDYRDSMKRR